MTTKKAQENMKHAAPKKRSQLGMVWHQLLKKQACCLWFDYFCGDYIGIAFCEYFCGL